LCALKASNIGLCAVFKRFFLQRSEIRCETMLRPSLFHSGVPFRRAGAAGAVCFPIFPRCRWVLEIWEGGEGGRLEIPAIYSPKRVISIRYGPC
jgi:hypothetical protein